MSALMPTPDCGSDLASLKCDCSAPHRSFVSYSMDSATANRVSSYQWEGAWCAVTRRPPGVAAPTVQMAAGSSASLLILIKVPSLSADTIRALAIGSGG
jgi:hypothetical protein